MGCFGCVVVDTKFWTSSYLACQRSTLSLFEPELKKESFSNRAEREGSEAVQSSSAGLKNSMWLAYHPSNASSIDRTLRKEGPLRRRRRRRNNRDNEGGEGEVEGDRMAAPSHVIYCQWMEELVCWKIQALSTCRQQQAAGVLTAYRIPHFPADIYLQTASILLFTL